MDFPSLHRLFRDHHDAYRRIAERDAYGIVRADAERLIDEARGLHVGGIEKLAVDAGSYEKFRSLLAELRFAILFADADARVELLGDQAFGSGNVYTPDLRIVARNGLEILVEVARRSEGATDVTEELQMRIVEAGLPVRVTHVLGPTLSVPGIDSKRRAFLQDLKESTVRFAVETIGELFATSACGTVHIFDGRDGVRADCELGPTSELPMDVQSEIGEQWIGSFVFETETFGDGYASGGVTSVHAYDDESHRAAMLRLLETKARKRRCLPSRHTVTPFIVAVQNDEVELDPTNVLSALTGSRCYLGTASAELTRASRTLFPDAVQQAARAGWESLLVEWDYVHDSALQLTDFGVYLNANEGEWSRNLSGVMVAHGTRAVQWLPNPFCEPAICDNTLLQIGLSYAKLGVPIR